MAATSDAKSDSFPQTGSFWTVRLIEPVQKADSSSSPSLQNKDPEGRDGSTSRGWRWVGLGIRGWWRVGLGECKVGGFGSRSNLAPWILCSAVRIISIHHQLLTLSSNDVTIKMYTMYFYYKDVIHLIVKVLSDHPYFEYVTGQPIWFRLLKVTFLTCFRVVAQQWHGRNVVWGFGKRIVTE